MTNIIEQLASSFDVNLEFVTTILSQKGILEEIDHAGDLNDFVARIGDRYKFVSYALGTNTRGMNSLARMLALATPTPRGKALDLGCGYGGFMQAFAKKGYRPFGIEIDPRLAELAKINLKNESFEFEIHVGDIFSDDIKLNGFDLITVNDVLEHLADPITSFNKLASMLNPGGVLAIYAPNGQSIFNATADPHNRVFGSSSMPGILAKTYVQATLNSSGYGLGDYLDLTTLRDLCYRNRMKFRYASHDGGERPEQAIDYLKKLVDRFAKTDISHACPQILTREVQTHMWNYISGYSASAAKATRGDGYTEFNDHYLARAWTICCTKE